MFKRLLYYGIIIPVSKLPLAILYLFSDLMYVLFLTILPYRKKTVEGNIARSFPDKSKREQKRIRNRFYRHFCDLMIEGIKNLTISETDLRNRMRVKNPELMEQLYQEGKDVILVSGHYNNWEWLITAQDLLFPHRAIGLGKPLSSDFFDKKINTRRERHGLQVVHAGNYRQELHRPSEVPLSLLVLADQSPTNPQQSYWMDFLDQTTPVLFGAEMIAHEFDYPVVFFTTHKLRRGYYQIELSLITESPRTMLWGAITEAHVRMLETAIQEAPEYWLWSHRRWKREVPDDLPKLRQEQKAYFNRKLGYEDIKD